MPWVGKTMDRKATRRRVAASRAADAELTRKAQELCADLPPGVVELIRASYEKRPLKGFSSSTYRVARERGLREDGHLTELGSECGRLIVADAGCNEPDLRCNEARSRDEVCRQLQRAVDQEDADVCVGDRIRRLSDVDGRQIGVVVEIAERPSRQTTTGQRVTVEKRIRVEWPPHDAALGGVPMVRRTWLALSGEGKSWVRIGKRVAAYGRSQSGNVS